MAIKVYGDRTSRKVALPGVWAIVTYEPIGWQAIMPDKHWLTVYVREEQLLTAVTFTLTSVYHLEVLEERHYQQDHDLRVHAGDFTPGMRTEGEFLARHDSNYPHKHYLIGKSQADFEQVVRALARFI